VYHAARPPMKQKEHHGYMVTANSRHDSWRKWRSYWSAVRLAGGHAQFTSPGQNAVSFSTESEADDAGLLAGCAWVDSIGRH
jgi:hypothetical protein